jgi:hypothetical protein
MCEMICDCMGLSTSVPGMYYTDYPVSSSKSALYTPEICCSKDHATLHHAAALGPQHAACLQLGMPHLPFDHVKQGGAHHVQHLAHVAGDERVAMLRMEASTSWGHHNTAL